MTHNDPKRNLIRGAFWTVGTRWIIKALGFINTIVMARLLMPEDFGIVAMGMLIVGLIQTFLDFGATTALLRKDQVTSDEIDSAWTLRVMQGLAASSILFLIPPLAIFYFKEPRLQYVLWTFGVCILLASATNIGLTLAQKEFNFALGFKVEITAKLASVLTTLAGGALLGDYRALVIGIVFGFLTPLVTSYLWHPYRPRWNTSKISEIWLITKWLLLSSVGNFIIKKGDELIAGSIASTHNYGLYNVGADFGQLPVQEIGPAMVRALLPVLSKIQNDNCRTIEAVIKTTSAVNTIVWPVGIGFMAISSQITELVLGTKWLDAIPFIQIFALISIFPSSIAAVQTLLTISGLTKYHSHLIWIELIIFVVAASLLVPELSLIGLAYARLTSTIVISFFTIVVAHFVCDVPFGRIILSILKPVICTIVMGLGVIFVSKLFDGLITQIVCSILFGATIYTLIVLAFWIFSGRPDGLERVIIDAIRSLKKKLQEI